MPRSMRFVKTSKKEPPLVSIHQPEYCICFAAECLDHLIANFQAARFLLGYRHFSPNRSMAEAAANLGKQRWIGRIRVRGLLIGPVRNLAAWRGSVVQDKPDIKDS